MHTHIGGEEFIVLDGTFHDQYGSFPAGTYVRNPIGTEHAPWVEDDGCTIIVKLLQMADPTATDESDLPYHIHLDQAKTDSGKIVDCGTVASLYSNEITGENVEIYWMNPNTKLPSDVKCLGGEELFILSGSIQFDNMSDKGEMVTYDRWGWLRFPSKTEGETGEQRQPIQAGEFGAQIYRKTGHLTGKALSMEKIQIDDNEVVVSK
jgi:hypothetical protein